MLIFTQYFTPEIGATQTRLHTFASGLAGLGHDVEVICEVPNHPQGIVRAGYGHRLVDQRRLDGFAVTYVWVRTNRIKTTRTRLAFYGSYMAMAAAVGSFRRRPDVIFASSPPLSVAAAAAIVAQRHRVPWVMDVRDLWPEAAVAVGELSNPKILAAAERLERWLYRRAYAITTVTGSFKKSIEAKSERDKVHLLPNGTTDLYLNAASLVPNRAALGVPSDRFIWTYAGNLGVAQGLETAIDAAGMLGDRFQLLLLGDGPVRRTLERRAASLAHGSVVFRDQVPPDAAVHYLRASDALLVSLGSDPALRKFVPSKLYDYCAVGKPVIVVASGEASELVARENAALPCPPGDAIALARAIRRLSRDPSLRYTLAANGVQFARRNLRAETVTDLTKIIEKSVDARRQWTSAAALEHHPDS